MTRYLLLALLTLTVACDNSTNQKDQKMFSFFKKKNIIVEKLAPSDFNIIFNNTIVDGVTIELLEIGKLNTPTGQIVVCDPLVVPNTMPLNKTVQPGEYPIKIYVAKTKESGDRYAIAKLEFSSKRADKWVLAVRDGEDVSQLKDEDEFYGFPVDAGLGGFFDYKAGLEYNKFVASFEKANPNGNIYDDFFDAEFKKNALNPNDPNDPNDYGNWINFKIPNTDLNITMFQSGYGDGTYPAYWGTTNDNEIVSLVIDFLVLSLPKYKK